jgi:hypothetical protein
VQPAKALGQAVDLAPAIAAAIEIAAESRERALLPPRAQVDPQAKNKLQQEESDPDDNHHHPVAAERAQLAQIILNHVDAHHTGREEPRPIVAAASRKIIAPR